VIPLNEECGLLEWVQNTTGLRHILNKILQEKGLLFVIISITIVVDIFEEVYFLFGTNALH